MAMDSPLFSCIVLSHNKPEFVAEAIGSLVRQSFPNFEGIVVDSGVLYDQGYFESLPDMADPRIRLFRSEETEDLRRTKTIASWCFNECFRKNLVRGKYVTYLCDDDLLYPDAFAAFHRHIQANPGTMAMYGSVDMTVTNRAGERFVLQEIPATETKGRCCGGGPLDCRVDYLQLCHHIDALKVFPTDEYWSEDRAVIRHADGIFLETIGAHFPILPVDAKIGENRKVPGSLNDGGAMVEWMAEKCRRRDANRRLRAHLGLVGSVLIETGLANLFRPPLPARPAVRAG